VENSLYCVHPFLSRPYWQTPARAVFDGNGDSNAVAMVEMGAILSGWIVDVERWVNGVSIITELMIE
jgi:hypothetical protein